MEAFSMETPCLNYLPNKTILIDEEYTFQGPMSIQFIDTTSITTVRQFGFRSSQGMPPGQGLNTCSDLEQAMFMLGGFLSL